MRGAEPVRRGRRTSWASRGNVCIGSSPARWWWSGAPSAGCATTLPRARRDSTVSSSTSTRAGYPSWGSRGPSGPAVEHDGAMADLRAGQPAEPRDLIDVAHLVTAYYTGIPDPEDVDQQVAFGTSGH